MPLFNHQDHYALKAKKDGFRARSAFKLAEINQSLRLIKADSIVLDLGCAPGSWLQYVAQIIGKNGCALGIDLSEVEPGFAKNIVCAQADIFSLDQQGLQDLISTIKADFSHFDVVLSDMAPKTSGIRHADQFKSLELAKKALSLADRFLRPGGHVVIKVFGGGDVHELISSAKKIFKQVKQVRPKSVRTMSREFYVVGMAKI